ncbi:MAG: hypothetical protein LBG95_01555 [Treponema sp.]|jgi:cbb3-type cytochrome oxidase cytochrome c subunit|nr:hypothetical protein [Treponema sp.]
MKKLNVLLMIIIVILAGIIFASCLYMLAEAIANIPDSCPYCNTELKDQSGPYNNQYTCNFCHKTFVIVEEL